MKIKIKKLLNDVKTPTYGTYGSACFDFYAPKSVKVYAQTTKLIPLGLAVEVPKGYALFIVPRSSTGLKTHLRQSNSVGVIDSDYRGEIAMMFDNISSDKNYQINEGERVAQGFVLPVPRVEFEVVDELSPTERGEGGFGSTGA